MLWTSVEAMAATNGLCQTHWQARGVCIDSRAVQAGDLFIALKDQRDGHDFVADALAKGAVAALVTHRPKGVAKDAPLLIVADVLTALNDLAVAARARSRARVIAITGSVGKTSTKEMLRVALTGQGRVHAAESSLNNHWGVPLTLARMRKDSDFALIEIGMNHAGEISPLSKLTRPDVALITTVAAAHMAAFASLEAIAVAKAEVFDGLVAGGVAILNLDIPSFDFLAKRANAAEARLVGFGRHKSADFQLVQVINTSNGATLKARMHGEEILLRLSAAGDHLAMNAMAVLAAVEAVGGDTPQAALALASWQPPKGRGERHWVILDANEPEQRFELIDDAYNANPTSLAAAFEVLSLAQPVDGLGRIKAGRRIAFVTDMLELGQHEAKLHADIAALPSLESVDLLHCAGPLSKHLFEAIAPQKRGEWHETAENLAAQVHRLLDGGDVAMVKGSKGSRAVLIVDAILKLGQAGNKNNKESR